MQTVHTTLPWPYPRWIAHRGAGKLAPENTLAAFVLGAQWGYRMFECDVKLSQDGIPFLLHDETLFRTTNARALWPDATDRSAGDYAWQQLATLDAGSWHSPTYAVEPLPSLEAILHWSIQTHCCLNLEIKPCTGAAYRTGKVVAQHVLNHWDATQSGLPPLPLLSSFQTEALWGAYEAAPSIPRALLLDTLCEGWLNNAQALNCTAVVLHHPLVQADTVEAIRMHGMRVLSYTVNEDAVAERLTALHIDGIITDRVDYFLPERIGNAS
jgi:glycerophosphoryl diester phosphodiesterase